MLAGDHRRCSRVGKIVEATYKARAKRAATDVPRASDDERTEPPDHRALGILWMESHLVMPRMMGKAVRERIHYEQCGCGKYCRKERKLERKLQRRIEKQRLQKEVQHDRDTHV
jgi:hypothetical protein